MAGSRGGTGPGSDDAAAGEPGDPGEPGTPGASRGAGAGDDAAWREIVANFGERATLDDDPSPSGEPGGGAAGAGEADDTDGDRLRRLFQPWERPGPAPAAGRTDDESDLARADGAPFVPPVPPPVPRTTPDRRAAWLGLLGTPAVLLVCLLIGVDLPRLVLAALVAAFVVGFCYLVATMSREPRDPGDDGARL